MVLKVGVAAPHKRREDSMVQYLNAPCLTAAINTAVWWLCRHLWSMYQEDLVPSFRRQTFTLIQTTNSTWICPIRPETSSLNGAEGQFHFWEMAASFRFRTMNLYLRIWERPGNIPPRCCFYRDAQSRCCFQWLFYFLRPAQVFMRGT